MLGPILFILLGVAFLAGSYVIVIRKRKKKSMEQRVLEMFGDYDKQMDKFRK